MIINILADLCYQNTSCCETCGYNKLRIMNIQKIDIRNFRGFERRSFAFNSKLALIIGNNTSGKTTLLHALQVALGAYLKCLKSLPTDKAYSCNFSQRDRFLKYNPLTRDYMPNEENTMIEVSGEFSKTTFADGKISMESEPVSWGRELSGNTTKSVNDHLSKIVKEMEGLRRDERAGSTSVLPLVLSFATNRIDNQYRAATKKKEKESRMAKAYKAALKDTVDFQGAFDWLYRYERDLKSNLVTSGTFDSFIKALNKAIPALTDIYIDTKNNEFSACVEVRDLLPTYQTFEHMSDGFKSVICISAEIAHRCVELNGFLGAEAVEKTPGIVMIDELELYLHPRWQMHILEDLQRAFPNIQFIVTTHSPFIIQSVKKENLVVLDGVTSDTDPIYRSIEEIAATEMNMPKITRSQRYQKMIELADKYYDLVMSGKTDEQTAAELDEMEAEYSDNPAYAALLKAERRSR